MTRRTPLFDLHHKLGARIVDFGGWDMPLQYGSQIAEHHAVRRAAGVFDVSHMCVVDLKGERVRPFLLRLLANDVARLKVPGKALYGCMLDESGGVIDDLIVYFLGETWFRAVTWAAEPSRRTLVGYSRSMDTIAKALWEHQPPTAQLDANQKAYEARQQAIIDRSGNGQKPRDPSR